MHGKGRRPTLIKFKFIGIDFIEAVEGISSVRIRSLLSSFGPEIRFSLLPLSWRLGEDVDTSP